GKPCSSQTGCPCSGPATCTLSWISLTSRICCSVCSMGYALRFCFTPLWQIHRALAAVLAGEIMYGWPSLLWQPKSRADSVPCGQMKLCAFGFHRPQAAFAEQQGLEQLPLIGAGYLPRSVALQVAAERFKGGHAGTDGIPRHVLDAPGQAGFRILLWRCGVLEQLGRFLKFQRSKIDELAQRGNAERSAQRIQPLQMLRQLRQNGTVKLEMTLVQSGETQDG